MILNKYSQENINSMRDQNIKINQAYEKNESIIHASQIQCDASNYVQNGTELQILENFGQSYQNSQQLIPMTSKIRMNSQNSLSLQNADLNVSDFKVKNKDENSKKKNCQVSPSIQTIDLNNRAYQETKKNLNFQQSKQLHNKGSYHANLQQAALNIDLKMLQRIKKQIFYFHQLFTNSGRRVFFEQKSIRKHIKDKSDIYEDKSNKLVHLFYKIREYLQGIQSLMKIFSFLPLINPDGIFHFFVSFFFCFYNTMFFITFTLFEVFQAPQNICFVYEFITTIIWILEIIIKLNTSIYVNRLSITTNRKLVLINYIKKRFLFDVIPLLLITVIIPIYQEQKYVFLKIFVILKYKNIFVDFDQIQKYFVMTFQKYYIIQLVNLVVKLFLIGHIIACFYYIIGTIELEYLGEEKTWYGDSRADQIWWKLYLKALYWALTLMTTGSSEADTPLQQFYISFIMLSIFLIFAYLLNVIGVILEELDTKDLNKRKDLNIINEFMRQKKISNNLQKKVNNDIEYYYENNLKKFEEDTGQVLSKLSKQLNDQLQEEYKKQILSHIPILNNNFSQEALTGIHHSFEEAFYFPNQMVHIQRSDISSDNSLIFIVQGKLEITKSRDQFQEEKQTKIFSLKKNGVVGAYHFFTGLNRDYNIKSLDFTKIIKIKRESFINSLSKFEKDFQIFCQIKDHLINDANFQDINYACLYCNQKTHLETQCPFIFYNKQHCSLRQIFTKSKNQERKKVNRRFLTMNSRSNNAHIRDSLIAFIQDCSFVQEKEDQQEIENQCSCNFSLESSLNLAQNEKNQIHINEMQEGEDLNKIQSIAMDLINEEEQKNKRSQKEIIKKKLKSSIFFKRETTKMNELNRSPQIMRVNELQQYFAETQKQSQNALNASNCNEKASGESQRLPNIQIIPNKVVMQNSQDIYEEYDNGSFFETEKKNDMRRFKSNEKQVKNENINELKIQLAGKVLNLKQNKILEPAEENFQWYLDKQQDYKYYYPNGNLKQALNKHFKYVKQKLKKLLKKKK
ncbi:cyclic nucleotide-binding domain protein (macronuclear) [Tetrahymena thermophila SB210]|uniref:Cyclic nucleotide-binding domain protein n=1 Tax=Tetrahymena thermophila (strain SB210) TaxID=312017 RepID=Q23QD6_TETTS|nr:cyclic nucleotide-binding domain protein [Tetrahymena thermophila SB210]EAR98648.2 cyclic nucleotide-binding domain protein [Tetrahymena thermophila SB210]|eukprot:XP_001018893.2 cyclic nucleotide-binding domain protein [Tetrahymena thermophila SB210]